MLVALTAMLSDRGDCSQGEVLLFDDSYEHEVWNDAATTRAVLIIDLWHPEITAEETREEIRKHFVRTHAGRF